MSTRITEKQPLNQRGALTLGKKEKAPNITFGAPAVVDLTPPRSREAREKRELTRKWTGIVIGAAVLTALAIVAGFGLRLLANNSYKNELESQETLTANIAKYEEVDEALKTVRDLESKREIALQNEASWGSTIEKVEEALPNGAALVSYTASAGGNPTVENAVGMAIVAQISSPEPISYADLIGRLYAVEGIRDVQIGDLSSVVETLEDESTRRTYNYAVAIGFDNRVFTKRFMDEPASTTESETN